MLVVVGLFLLEPFLVVWRHIVVVNGSSSKLISTEVLNRRQLRCLVLVAIKRVWCDASDSFERIFFKLLMARLFMAVSLVGHIQQP